MACLAAGLISLPSLALAQATNQSDATTAPATNTVGPNDLQNFNLQGTVTRPAEQPPATPPATTTTRRQPTTAPAEADRPSAAPAETRGTPAAPTVPLAERRESADQRPEPLRQTPPASSVTVALPQLGDAPTSSATAPAFQPATGFTPVADPVSTPGERDVPFWPWLLAALALGAGGAFLFWRNRSAHAYAGGPQVDAFVAPEPRPAPAPRAAPPRPAPTPPAGVVSTRLRPWIEIGFEPRQCVLEDDKVTLDFDIELFNSGSAPARAVLAEASLFNAGTDQNRVLGAFFANPAGVGERIVSIEPLKRVVVRSQVVAPRSQVQEYQLAGRKVFVPVIAFNALYRWSKGEGQTSAAYLLGGEAEGDKLAPFRLDLGSRAIGKVAARPLPLGVRN